MSFAPMLLARAKLLSPLLEVLAVLAWQLLR
jgi:hypothetical protein